MPIFWCPWGWQLWWVFCHVGSLHLQSLIFPCSWTTLLYRSNLKCWLLTFKWASNLRRYAWPLTVHLCWNSNFSSNIIFHFLQIMWVIYINCTFQYQIWRSVVNLWVMNHSLNNSFGSSHWEVCHVGHGTVQNEVTSNFFFPNEWCQNKLNKMLWIYCCFEKHRPCDFVCTHCTLRLWC